MSGRECQASPEVFREKQVIASCIMDGANNKDQPSTQGYHGGDAADLRPIRLGECWSTLQRCGSREG